METKLLIFTDASFEPKTKRSVCGYVCIMQSEWEAKQNKADLEVVLRVFQDLPSIAAAELRAVILALQTLSVRHFDAVQIYSDSPAVTGLLRRKENLEASQFISKRSGKILNHAEAYQVIFKMIEGLRISITALRGHVSKEQRTGLDESFSAVDRATRKRLSVY